MPLVLVLWVLPSSTLFSSTVALATTAWLGSVTVPAISPEMSDCAKAAGAIRLATSSTVISAFLKLKAIFDSPEKRKFVAQTAKSRIGTADRSTRNRKKPALSCWLNGLDTYKLLLGNSCSKELSLLGHITQAVMVMIRYLFQNWEDSDRIRYEISYGKELEEFAGRVALGRSIPPFPRRSLP